MQNFGQNLEKKPGWNSLLAKMGYSSSKLAMGRIPYCATVSIRLACWFSLIKILWLLIVNVRAQHTTSDFWGGDHGSKVAERVNVLNALFFREHKGRGGQKGPRHKSTEGYFLKEFGLQHFLHTHVRIIKCFRKHSRDTHR